jgi:hypothetical protein
MLPFANRFRKTREQEDQGTGQFSHCHELPAAQHRPIAEIPRPAAQEAAIAANAVPAPSTTRPPRQVFSAGIGLSPGLSLLGGQDAAHPRFLGSSYPLERS